MNRTVNLKRTYAQSSRRPGVKVGDVLAFFVSSMIYGAEFTAYLISYGVYSARCLAVSDAVRRASAFYRRYVRIWVITAVVFALFGIVGGMEAGMISFAVGFPVFVCACVGSVVYYKYFY